MYRTAAKVRKSDKKYFQARANFGDSVFRIFCGNFTKLGFLGVNLTTDFTDYTDF